MHIQYIPTAEESTTIPKKGRSKGQRKWALMRFIVVTGFIFLLTFLAVNFNAYRSIAANAFNPEVNQEKQTILEAATTTKKINPEELLPKLPESPEIQKQYPWVGEVMATDNRLIIPKLGKNVPLVHMDTQNLEGKNWGALEEQITKGLSQGVVHYPGTAKPGETGNVFITGHSSYYPWKPSPFNDVFALLGQLEIGDKYYIVYEGREYEYQVYDKYEVMPDNVSVLNQTTTPDRPNISMLMTCTPTGTTLRRLIIEAEEINDGKRQGPKLPTLG